MRRVIFVRILMILSFFYMLLDRSVRSQNDSWIPFSPYPTIKSLGFYHIPPSFYILLTISHHHFIPILPYRFIKSLGFYHIISSFWSPYRYSFSYESSIGAFYEGFWWIYIDPVISHHHFIYFSPYRFIILYRSCHILPSFLEPFLYPKRGRWAIGALYRGFYQNH